MIEPQYKYQFLSILVRHASLPIGIRKESTRPLVANYRLNSQDLMVLEIGSQIEQR